MKRIITIASTGATLLSLALLPATASAQRGHHRHHHSRAHARLQSFGTANPVAPASDNAGAVTSFTAGVLTIKLSDGTTVTGKVTAATELKCEPAASVGMARIADHGAGGDTGSAPNPSGDGRGGPGSSDSQSASGATPAAEPAGDSAEDIGEVEDQPAPPVGGVAACETASLIPGAVVRRAELSVTSAGATFAEVEIIR
jgi:hypothetical protein